MSGMMEKTLHKTPDIIIDHQTKAMTRKISITQEHTESVREANETAILTLTQSTW
jgi:hypothetical protein